MINAEKDILVILTRCPKFICKKFCELNFTKIKWKLYGSLLSVNDNEFTGGVKLKLNNKIKKIICEYEKLNSFAPSLLTTGYGDSIDDIDFLETVDKSYGLTKEICNSNSNIIYLKPKWTNVCSL